MEIRKLTQADPIDPVSRVYAACWKTAYREMVPDSYLDALPENRWSPFLQKDLGRVFIALENNAVIGACSISPARLPEKSGWGEVVSLYVLPGSTRKGVGTGLMRAAVAELSALGFASLYLWVLEENQTARRFYEHFGFSFNGVVRTDEIGGQPVKEAQYSLVPCQEGGAPVKIQESGENYLETILVLHQKKGCARAIDVANELGFSKASVSRAVSILKNAGLVDVEHGGNLALTEQGKAKANAVYERHNYIGRFLELTLGLSREQAVEDACRIEHILSVEAFDRMKAYVEERAARKELPHE